jgi:glycosyltransferase involved in cell wall biosynthesis
MSETDHELPPATIALLPWGNVIEDFLDTLGISLESFCNEFTGSWMFAYVDALGRVGVRTVLICISASVVQPSRFTHRPTGCTIYMLPVPKVYRFLRRKIPGPYGRTVKQMFGEIRGSRLLLFPALAILKEVRLYLTTPLRSLARVLHDEGCQAILCQEYEYPRFDLCVLLGRLMHLPVFATFQGGDYHHSRVERLLRPLAMRASAGLIVAPQSEVQRLQALYIVSPGKVARIFTPIDVQFWSVTHCSEARAELGIRLDAQVVLWHGRISLWQKGLDILLDAWKQVCSERPGRDLRLLLVGAGQDSEKLRQRLTAMQQRNVLWVDKFIHDRATIRRYLSAGDIYVLPSRHEGFPLAPLEAMACGLPIVAADAQGIPDILAGGETSGGLIVPRNDAPALALALGRLLDDEAWRLELGRRAGHRIEASFSPEAVGMQLRTFLTNGRN